MKAGRHRGNNRGDKAGTWARNNYREGEQKTKEQKMDGKGKGGLKIMRLVKKTKERRRKQGRVTKGEA